MKKTCTYLFLLLSTSTMSQNLVPNPSFELFDTCPNATGQIARAVGWQSFTDSPDYFNSCNNPLGLGVPQNGLMGYQLAYEGVAYAGLLNITCPGNALGREYIGIQLVQPLIINQTYYVSFRTVLSNVLGRRTYANKLGAKFTTYSFSALEGVNDLVTNWSHVYTDSLISDTLNWATVKGLFIADSSYQYIVIGNFFDNAHTDTMFCLNGGYVAIDFVCVSTDSLICYTSTSFNEINTENNITIYPNPADDYIELSSLREAASVLLYDEVGRLVFEKDHVNYDFKLSVKNLAEGLYGLQIRSNKKNLSKKIIIKHY